MSLRPALLFRLPGIIFLSLLFFSCLNDQTPSGTDTPAVDIEIVEPGYLSINGEKLLFGTNNNTDNPLWLVIGTPEGEGIGVLADHDTAANTVTMRGVAYVDSNGNSFSAHIDAQGRPDSVFLLDGSMFLFSDYTSTDVKVTAIDPAGNTTATQSVPLGNDYRELTELVSEYGLTFEAGTELQKYSAVAGKISGWSLTLKITGNIISIVGCGVGTVTAPTVAGAALMVAACVSAAQGVASTILYVTGDDSLSNLFGLSSTIWGAFACPTGDIGSCVTTVLSTIDNLISGCEAENNQALKACRDGWVYWFDDCGKPYEPVEECPCGCENAACIPIEACSTGLSIDVAIAAAPPCDTVGRYLFFTAEVSGGDTDSYIYTWDFGDGTSSVLKEESHAYEKEGNYTVTLTVTDTKGNYGFASLPVEIGSCSSVSEVIIASSRECADIDQSITFSSLVRGGDRYTYRYTWDFGDGSGNNESEPSHSYSDPGTYTVSLSVTDADGGHATATLSQKVGSCSSAVEVTISSGTDCADVDEVITFSAEVTGEPSEPLTLDWNFGDGAFGSGTDPTHAYADTGTYTVRCEVTDSRESTSVDELTVRVGGCNDTVTGSFSGTIIYAFVDTTVKPAYSGIRIMDAETGTIREMQKEGTVSQVPLAVNRAGDIIFMENDQTTSESRLMHSGNWGRNTAQELGTACGSSGCNWSTDDMVDIDDDGTVYFHASYDSLYYDSLLEREVTARKRGLMALDPYISSCPRVPIDFDGDGDWANETWDDTDCKVAANGSVILLSHQAAGNDELLAVSPDGGIPVRITDLFDGSLQVSANGAVCLYETESTDLFPHIMASRTDGSATVDLSSSTGMDLLNAGPFLNHDGTMCVTWAMDMDAQKLQLMIIPTDGGTARAIVTGDVILCSNSAGGFTADDNGIVFIGTTDSEPSYAVGDIYYVDLQGGTPVNLTATPDIHEDIVFVR